MVGNDFLEDYRMLLHEVLLGEPVGSVLDPSSIGSAWGQEERPFREIIGGRFSVSSDHLLLDSGARPVNASYAVVSSLWIILGRRDLAPLQPFNPRGSAFSADGYTLSGAFGWRLRGQGIDQIGAVIDLLRMDPNTRRAICYIGSASDHATHSRDFPCASSVQFFLRGGSLTAHVHMRSQSLFGVFPYDLVNFRYLQQYVAWSVGADVGDLSFTFGSLHVYEAERDRILAFCDDAAATARPLPALDWATAEQTFGEWTSPDGPSVLDDFLSAHGWTSPVHPATATPMRG